MTITIWHNPRCSKSRETLELLKKKGVEPTVREYLKQPWEGITSLEQLQGLRGQGRRV
jgi:arsenate reductase